jgi:hypothetical protein
MSTAQRTQLPPPYRGGARRPVLPAHGRSAVPAVPAVLVYLGAPDKGPSPDLPGLARAVERLVHSLAPDVVTRVTIALPPVDEAADPAEDAPATRPTPGTSDTSRTSDIPDAGRVRVALAEGLHLDLGGRLLDVDGRRQPLTRREFELLAYLQRRRGVAISRRELMSHVWGAGYLAGDRTIDVHVRRLRLKLGRHHERITTLRGYGYRFD